MYKRQDCIVDFKYLGVFENKAYYLSNETSNAPDAFTNAETSGGFIATVDSQELNDWLKDTTNDLGVGTILIGYTDRVIEDEFEWHSGSTSDYHNFPDGEPNDFGTGEDYVFMRSTGLWNDTNSSSMQRFVIEIEVTPWIQTAGLPSGGFFPVGTTTNTFEFTTIEGDTLTCSFNVTVSDTNTLCDTVYLNTKVFLQGAALNPNSGEEHLMRDDLRAAGLLPTTSPYSDGLICDTSVFNATGTNAIVDWIWLELIDQDNSSLITGQSALLQRDGDIVAADGISNITFSISGVNHYVVVSHRNHLGIRSANAVVLAATPTHIDFTTDASLVNGGVNTLSEIRNNTYAILSGDEDANGQVQNTDVNTVILIIGTSGYSNADMDLNGQIQNTDINNLVNQNIGKGEQLHIPD